MRFVFISFVFFSFLNGSDTSSTFTKGQNLLNEVKEAILKEEAIAKAYEKYLITKHYDNSNNFESYEKPISLRELKTQDYLGVLFKDTYNADKQTYFNNFVLNDAGVNYRLKDSAFSSNTNMIALYKSDTFRKKTFFYDNKIHFILEDDFAKNIYNLISKQNKAIFDCSNSSSGNYCIKFDNEKISKEQVYIYGKLTPSSSKTLIMYYYTKNFSKGPIIIIDNPAYYSLDEFLIIPIGSVLYDFTGAKYIKTKTQIRRIN